MLVGNTGRRKRGNFSETIEEEEGEDCEKNLEG